MSMEDNKATMLRMINDVIVGGNLTLMDSLVSPDFTNHNVVSTGEARATVGVESFRQEIKGLRAALPDIAVEVNHLLADGDYVVAHIRARGTHAGGSIPATGRRIDVPSISIVRIAEGKIAERWNLTDRYGMLQQLGAIPGR